MKFKCRGLHGKRVEGPALVSKKPISFLGDVDPQTGLIVAADNELHTECIAGKVFVFPAGRGSTVGSYTLLRLKKNKVAPLALVAGKSEAVIAVGAVIADIVLVDNVEKEFFNVVKNGDWIVVDAEKGYVEIVESD